MKRREFIVAASGVSGGAVAATAATPVVAQEEENGNDTETGDGGGGNDTEAGGGGNESSGGGGNESAGGGGGGGGSETVEVDDNEFVPAELTIEPGTTVTWEWVGSNQHNVNPGSQPEGANWEGQTDLQAEGTYEHTFETEGTYEYVCDPHVSIGMTGSIEVTSDAGGGGAATADVDIHELGVPIQKHFVGVASFFAIFIALTFTFYLLKYGESANTSSPGRK
ncbi:plastocyanin/azurin family copper-binding protein [Natronosalvus rutilus]|uniref:Plastocyanin/azurin family copper-binding protein n=1 Tax=Natronosalvus rutilus TaxID=2953753 RepID=A0A9E7N9Z5_9EURY|nr:plastocyanin/azurin family copper-binding protein [Natronosalvus rutilus]UTF53536.1 plastocyanin/azurin family copper-binding protein [Natronosalvus rutilus]